MLYWTSLLTCALLVAAAHAHPGHHEAEAMGLHHELQSNSRSNLNHCTQHHLANGLHQRAVERRAKLATELLSSPHLKGSACQHDLARKSSLTYVCCFDRSPTRFLDHESQVIREL